MPLNIRLALWISQVLCPRLGKRQPPPQVPDFVDDSPVTFMGYPVPVDKDLLDEDISKWEEYISTRPNNIEHLHNCLKR
jgi:hypothetical protein